VVREFCGHGIGQVFHEEPQVLHYGKPGTLTLRGTTKAKVFAVRGLGAKEARKRLAEMAEQA
jgi:methionine aminopeptidase